MRVFVAGASGAIGEPLIAELLKQGHFVVGMTTSEARAKTLESQGAEAVIIDAFHAAEVETALRQAKAEAVIDELTSLPKEQSDMPKFAAGDRKLRIEGGGNLFRAAITCGVRRYLQQSSGFLFEGGGRDTGGRVVSVGYQCKSGCGGECADVYRTGGTAFQFQCH